MEASSIQYASNLTLSQYARYIDMQRLDFDGQTQRSTHDVKLCKLNRGIQVYDSIEI